MEEVQIVLMTRGRRITREMADGIIALDEISGGKQERSQKRHCTILDPVRGLQPTDGLPCDEKYCANFQICKGEQSVVNENPI